MDRLPARLAARLVGSARALLVMRRRDWMLVVAAILAGTLLMLTLLVAQVDAYRARSLAAEQAQAQASIVADQRAAQSHRIDALTEQLADTREQMRVQASLVGRQEQAIRDLAAQVDELGGRPVATAVAPEREATRKPVSTATTSPTTSPAPSSSLTPKSPAKSPSQPTTQPQPSPDPHDNGPLGVCALLPLC